MIIIIIAILYSLLVVKIKFTPIVSTLTWINRHVISKILAGLGKLLKKFSKKKVSKFAHVDDPFTYQPPAKAPLTKGQKNVDKAGDEISKILVELGKVFVNVDKRIKYFGIGLLNVSFLTGAYFHIRWACQYWEVSLVLVVVFIEWLTWIKINIKPKEEPVKQEPWQKIKNH